MPKKKTIKKTAKKNFTHFDGKGNAVMVDVSAKAATTREAVAKGSVYMEAATLRLINRARSRRGRFGRGAIGGIQAAKAHPRPYSTVSSHCTVVGQSRTDVRHQGKGRAHYSHM